MEKCPAEVSADFEAGLSKRKAIYKTYAQAIPSAFVLDPVNCRQLGHGKKCGICAKVCPADAVDYEQKEKVLNLEVGAVILATGFRTFDPRATDSYAYANHPNVVTSLEFERLLSAGGPTQGHVVRPSDLALKKESAAVEKELKKLTRQLKRLEEKHGKQTEELVGDFKAGKAEDIPEAERWIALREKVEAFEAKLPSLKQREKAAHEPKKIAWLQCVGSRDINHCDNGYCSAVCCMYAIKEAVIAKEHAKDGLDAAIFYMDIRTHGKDFERYYNRAQENGVRFVRSRIHSVDPVRVTENLRLQYVSEQGETVEEEFDMVVLSVGLEASSDTVELAEKLGIDLNHYQFAATSSFSPVATSRPGIYACGVLQGPKDIPQSVMEASAAASAAGSILAPARDTLTTTQETPSEIDIKGEPPRVGVFVCHCGINIAGVVDVVAVRQYAKTLPYVVYAEDTLYSCSQDSQETMLRVVKEQNLNRVVVAACSPRTHEPLFQDTLVNSGLNKYLFEMANIRNHNSWVHSSDPQAATEKAKDLVRMAVAKVALLEPLQETTVEINQSALVVGGGVTGMVAALQLADQGYPVTLLEAKSELGGHARQLRKTWRGEDVRAYLKDLIARVNASSPINVFLNAELQEVKGFLGNFQSKVQIGGDKGAKSTTVHHGVAILATGGQAIQPDEYLYGQHPRVFSWHELEDALEAGQIKEPNSGVFIQCVGSREPERPYCSRICCTFSVHKAVELKERNPKMDVYILYRDIRTYGEREDIYKEARAKGVIFIHYDLENKPVVRKTDEGNLQITAVDQVLQRPITLEPDFITLASAIETRGAEALAQLFKVPLNEDKFFVEAHAKLRPVEFATDGVFLCGLTHYPKPLEESISQAQAATSRAITLLAQKTLQISGQVATVNSMKCSACGVCVAICPFGAPGFNDRGLSEINQALCKGCGLCVASCRSGAIDLKGYEDKQIFAMIEEL
jgi:heterodisulfide reductase subunit A-like polyferredoxin